MRKILLFILSCSPLLLSGQVGDAALKTLDSLIDLSRNLTGSSDFDGALRVNAAAEQLALEKWGRESAGYAAACHNRGRVMAYREDNPEAEKWYLAARDIQQKVLGREHPDYAVTLNDLGNLYSSTGNFEAAEQFLLEAKATWEKAGGKDHAYAGWSAQSLGTLYHRMHNYEKAELFYREAGRTRAITLGKDHPDYATTLCSQASLCMQLRQYKKAEALYTEAKAIQEKSLGKLHADYAHTLDGLAVLYDDYLKDTKKAETLYLEVRSIREQTLGKTHPDYGWSLGNLGNFYWYNGYYKKAEPLFLEAHTLWERTLGKTHPNYVWSLHKLWAVYWSLGDYAKAEQYMAEMSATEKDQLFQAAHYLSAEELSAYIRRFQDGLDEAFSFAGARPHTAGTCYDLVLFYKGFLLNAISQVHRLAMADTATAAKFEVLKSCERQLAAEYARRPAEPELVAALEEKANRLEKELTRGIAGFGEALRQVSWQEVQQRLRPDEAAIEFVHYKFVDPRPTDSVMYAALVLLPGAQAPLFLPLFEEKQLLALLQTKGASKAEYIDALYAAGPTAQLYQLIWRPLEKFVSAKKTVYFSPAGLLHYLNLAALPLPGPSGGAGAGKTLADRYHFVQLGSTRLLTTDVGVGSSLPAGGGTALLYGGIQYDLDSLAITQSIAELRASAAPETRSAPAFTDPTLRGSRWNYLKWTDVEVSSTETLLKEAGVQPVVRRGYAATEESFKTIGQDGQPSPRILHLATHGFFFPDPQAAGTGREPAFKVSEHPMIRAGLVLAGGNYAWQTGRPFRPDREDGILTAYEISQLNLRHTELVVLSACETGLGDIRGNEGIYGLQRAFKIAGAKYLIMSLWQVPDYQTQELMTAFYTHWMVDRMTIPEAFRAAQGEMRVKYERAFFWAGFVLVE